MVEVFTIGNEENSAWPVDELNASPFTMPNNILWSLPPDHLSLGTSDVHVWAAHLDPPTEELVRFAASLSRDEQERAARFRFERHRIRFIAARGVLRSILATHLDCAPHELQFEYGRNGKPVLATPFADIGLSFNLAHSEDLALIAVTRAKSIGVDVEQIRPVTDVDELVTRFFSPCESALFQTLPTTQKDAAFFNLWTRKEAWLKATGEGIAHSLNRVEVTFLPDEPARLVALPENSGPSEAWVIRELLPARGFVGAVALPNLQFAICNLQFPIPELL